MNDEDIKAALALADEAQARADAATQVADRPWTHNGADAVWLQESPGVDDVLICLTRAEMYVSLTVDLVERIANGRFIAHARQDVPALCDLVRDLAAEVLVLRAVLADAQKESAMYEKGVRDALVVVEECCQATSRHSTYANRAIDAVRALLDRGTLP